MTNSPTTETTADESVGAFLYARKDEADGPIHVQLTVASGETYDAALLGVEEYVPPSETSAGSLTESIEFVDQPLPDEYEPDKYPLQSGYIETPCDPRTGWGDATLSVAVQHVDDGELVTTDTHRLGTIDTITERTDHET